MLDLNILATSPLQGGTFGVRPPGRGNPLGVHRLLFHDLLSCFSLLVLDTAAACCTSLSHVGLVFDPRYQRCLVRNSHRPGGVTQANSASGALPILDYRLRDSIAFMLNCG